LLSKQSFLKKKVHYFHKEITFLRDELEKATSLNANMECKLLTFSARLKSMEVLLQLRDQEIEVLKRVSGSPPTTNQESQTEKMPVGGTPQTEKVLTSPNTYASVLMSTSPPFAHSPVSPEREREILVSYCKKNRPQWLLYLSSLSQKKKKLGKDPKRHESALLRRFYKRR